MPYYHARPLTISVVVIIGVGPAGLAGRKPHRPLMLPVSGDARPAAGITRLVPVQLHGGEAKVVAGSRPASLVAAAVADAIAVVEPDWLAGQPVWLLPLR